MRYLFLFKINFISFGLLSVMKYVFTTLGGGGVGTVTWLYTILINLIIILKIN